MSEPVSNLANSSPLSISTPSIPSSTSSNQLNTSPTSSAPFNSFTRPIGLAQPSQPSHPGITSPHGIDQLHLVQLAHNLPPG